jgi:small subunit ribosomal protein S17
MAENERAQRKTFQGTVVSDKMSKTRVVEVDRIAKHPLYDKVLRRTTKFYAHDEGNESKAGDVVEIASTRPLSKLKRWRVTRVVTKAKA